MSKVKLLRSKGYERSKVIRPRLMTALSSLETSLFNSVYLSIFETLISHFFCDPIIAHFFCNHFYVPIGDQFFWTHMIIFSSIIFLGSFFLSVDF